MKNFTLFTIDQSVRTFFCDDIKNLLKSPIFKWIQLMNTGSSITIGSVGNEISKVCKAK